MNASCVVSRFYYTMSEDYNKQDGSSGKASIIIKKLKRRRCFSRLENRNRLGEVIERRKCLLEA